MTNLLHNEPARLVFLLVDETLQPFTGAEPRTRISVNGAPFVDTQNAAQEIGEGWYRLDLDAAETGTPGPLIFLADAPGAAHQWRDILSVGGDVQAAVRAEIERWQVRIAVPVKLIRAGESD